jgi:NAD(P)-dependent dehydrogenase (short-subunit alcohol dehydrogenase family)
VPSFSINRHSRLNLCPGIGRGVAASFAGAGCTKIFLGDIDLAGLEETARLVQESFPSADVCLHKVDISSEESVQSFVDECVLKFGRLDYANNVAGVVPQRTPITTVDVSTLDWVVDVNLYGVRLTISLDST